MISLGEVVVFLAAQGRELGSNKELKDIVCESVNISRLICV